MKGYFYCFHRYEPSCIPDYRNTNQFLFLCLIRFNDLCDPSNAPIYESYFYTMGMGL